METEPEANDELRPEYDLLSLRVRKQGPEWKAFGGAVGTESILWNEYRQLSTAAENLVANSFQVPAVAVAIVTALAISGNVKPHYFGFGILIGMFLLSVWLGYYHSTLNTYGLQLLKLEKAINSQPGQDPSDRLTYYTNHVGKSPIGTQVYASLLAILIFIGIIFSGLNIWIMTRSLNWGVWVRGLCVTVFPLLTLVSFANIVLTERKIYRVRRSITGE